MNKLKVLDLFSGIGGFSLGLERAGGFKTVAFCEIDPYCRAVLAKQWPGVPCYSDVRTLNGACLRADGAIPDVICGGFPCQDISTAGRGAGLGGERSGLFYEIARLIGELGPRYVVLENVSALLSRGLDQVLGTLAALGYDAEWHCIPASAVGAHHRRDRVWIIAYPNVLTKRPLQIGDAEKQSWAGHDGQILANTHSQWELQPQRGHRDQRGWSSYGSPLMADAIGKRQSGSGKSFVPFGNAPVLNREAINAFSGCVGSIWRSEPDVGRVANGVPARLDRLKALGNAVVPQIPEIIGRAIMAAHKI